ncbi:MAG: TonB-dependent receptor [Bacteroidia bacterium]|nr:TonB-dependent receptor [Bacteroidia bacterium]MDW8157723.1 TonB-dependent receptor [Bacteroidia bacterium]
MHKIILILLFVLFYLSNTLLAQTGTLQGSIVDAVTNEPLAGAVITIEGTPFGAVADEEGKYVIRNIPQGVYSVKVSYVGYETQIKNQVMIEKGVTQLNFSLQQQAKETETIEITSSVYAKTSQSLVSVKTVGIEQIRSNPGGNFDISRVVQTLPGVSGSVGFRNDIIVRGGAPNENVFYLDGVEIPNINHFATQGSGGGPVGIINSAFIENVKFQSSAFGAKYDNTLSSVLDFEMISGNTERFQGNFLLSGTEAALTFDTPLGKKVTAIASVRRSYLQFLFRFIGLPFLPDYWDIQAKIKWEINPKTTLTYVRIGAIDRFSLNDTSRVEKEVRYLVDGLPIFEQDSYAQGLVLRRLTKRGYYTIALSRNRLDNRSYKYTNNIEVDSLKVLDFKSVEAENKLRYNAVSKIGDWEIGYGAVLQYATFSNNTFRKVSNLFNPEKFDTILVSNSIGLFRYGGYGTISRSFWQNRLKSTFGIRFDMNSFTTTGNNPLETLSPRLALSYSLSSKIALSGSLGTYYKLPPYTILGFEDKITRANNRNAKYIQSTHFVAGVEYKPNSSTIISLEGFYKIYNHYPVSIRDSISLANLGGGFGVFGNELTASVGKGRTYGVEIFFQKLLTHRLFGLASYTLYYSSFTGFDPNRYIRSSWDNRHLISVTGGYLAGKNKTWEIAGKWRFLGGAPYTPFDIPASIRFYLITGNPVFDWSRINQLETSVFSQVDIRITKKWYFRKWSLELFLDIQNLFNTPNPGNPNFTLERDPNNPSQFLRDANGNYIPQVLSINNSNVIPTIGVRIKL